MLKITSCIVLKRIQVRVLNLAYVIYFFSVGVGLVLYLKPEGRGAFGNGGNLLGWKAELCTPRPAHPVVPLSHGQDNIVLTRMTYFLFYPVLLYESACCSGVFICSSVLFCVCVCVVCPC